MEYDGKLSNYTLSLEKTAKERYLNKINVINCDDPYALPKSAWLQGLENLQMFPAIEYPDLIHYLIFTKSAYTLDDFKAYKGLDAYKLMGKGWVRDVMVRIYDVNRDSASSCSQNPQTNGNYHLLTAKVLHSQRLNEKPLEPWIIAKQDGQIISAHCNCMAGLGECCTHIAALLFYVEYAVRFRENKSCTSIPAEWTVPTLKKVPYSTINEIDWTSSRGLKKCLDKALKTSCEDSAELKKPSSSILKQKPISKPTTDEKMNYLERLHRVYPKSTVFSTFLKYHEDFIPACVDSKRYPVVLTELYDEGKKSLSFEELLKFCQSIEITITKEQVQLVEGETKMQSESKLWQRLRSGRITASKLKSACHTNPKNPSVSLIKAICYPNSAKFTSAATNWGCAHEQDAQEAYQQTMEKRHTNFKLEKSGLFLSVEYPYLGATPDGLVGCDCCGEGVLEVKCPFCIRHKKIDENYSGSNVCLGFKNGISTLLKNHAYYYQVQAQIFVTQRKYADFCLWTEEDFFCQRIFPDEEFWRGAHQKALEFFKSAVLPELVAKHFESKCTKTKEDVTRTSREISTSKSTSFLPITPNKMMNTASKSSLPPAPKKRKASCTKRLYSNPKALLQSLSESENNLNNSFCPQTNLQNSPKTLDLIVAPNVTPLSPRNQIPLPLTGNSIVSKHLVSPRKQLKKDNENIQPKYCYSWCTASKRNKYIGCDNKSCPVQWYHMKCLNMKKVPPGDWFCPECQN